MREGWTYKTFGEVGSFLRGKSIQKADFVEKGLPCIHYGQIHTKFGVSVDKHITEIPLDLYNKSIIASHGDVIIAITSEDLEGSCKSTAWLGNYDIAVSSHAAVYKHNQNPKFIAYYLRSNTFYCEKQKYARGFKVMEIKPTDIEKIPIPVPPISEQERIVSELDLLSGIIEKKKAQLKEYDQLAQSIFYDMFGDPVTNEKGWDIFELSTICDVRDGTHDSPKYVEFGYPLITSKNVINGTISFDNVNFISEDDLNAINVRSRVDDGDIIMPMIGTIGNPVIVHKSREFAIKNVALIKFSKSDLVINIYLQKLLDSDIYNHFVKEQNRGGTQKFVSLKAIRQFPIPLPPLSLQQSFAEKIEAIEKQKALIKQSITEVETLFNSRMDYYFN